MAAAPASATAAILALPLTPCTPLLLGWRRLSPRRWHGASPIRSSLGGRLLHEVPVEEALEAAVEVQLRARAQEAVALGRVGDVLERLAEAAQRRDVLLRLGRVDAVVALAVGDEDRDLDVLEAVDGRAGAVRRARARRVAHHPLEVLHAGPVALRPRRHDVDVAVDRDRAA